MPLLYGLEHLASRRARYGDGHVVAATIRVESTRAAAGRIEHTSPFAAIELATDAIPRPHLDDLAALLGDAGFDTKVRTDENPMLWDKISFLAPMALLTTRFGIPLGEVCDRRWDHLRTKVHR